MCKKKLKTLKDKMRDVTNKLPRTKNGLPDFDRGARWTFFESLLFMKDEFLTREPFYKHDYDPDTDDLDDCESTEDNSFSTSVSECRKSNSKHTPYSVSVNNPTPVSKSLMASKMPPRISATELPCKRLRGQTEDASDEDFETPRVPEISSRDEWDTFCSSISCDLRKIRDPLLVMEVKAKIHQTVHAAVLQQLQQDKQQEQETEPAFVHKNELV